MEWWKQAVSRFFKWRARHIRTKDFVLALSILIGLAGGLIAVGFKSLIGFLEAKAVAGVEEYLLLFFPLLGILMAVFLSYQIFRDHRPYGISAVLYAIARKRSIIGRSKIWSRMVTATFTVAFGGSVGIESPIFVSGSALGSNLGRWFHMDARKRTLLIGCGAAAGMAAIFDSPVAGMIFSLEVILVEYSISSFIPLLLSSATGTLVSMAILGEKSFFSFPQNGTFYGHDIPFFIVLGGVLGFLAVYFSRMTKLISGVLARWKNPYLKVVAGGLLIGILILLFPPLFGEGYISLTALLQGHPEALFQSTLFPGLADYPAAIFLFIALIIFLKVIAAGLTLHAGGSGGYFAPAMFTGGLAGYLFASLLNQTGIFQELDPQNYILVGMCGMLSGVMHAPLTGIFLIAEITESYALFIPLMLVAALSYFIKSYLERHSILTRELAEQGDWLTQDKDKQVLNLLQTDKLIEKELLKVDVDGKLRDVLRAVEKSKRNIFPVIDQAGVLKGIITLDDVRSHMFHPEAYDTVTIRSLMHEPPDYVYLGEPMELVMKKFDRSRAWNLPVVDREHHFIGLVSKSNIFSAYRTRLRNQAKSILE